MSKTDPFLDIANNMVIYHLRTSWLMISKMYNEIANEHEGTLAIAFALLAINEEDGTPVTKIAPRMGMEPNSLSRILKRMEDKSFIIRQKNAHDKRQSLVTLTALGKEKRKVALQAVFRLEKQITKDIPVQELAAFFSVSKSIPQAIDQFKTTFVEN